MIAGLVNFAWGIWRWIGRMFAAIGRWLRASHNWWRIGCFTLAGLCALASFVALDRQKTIVLVRTQATAAAQQCEADKAVMLLRSGQSERALDEITETLVQKARELAAIRRQNIVLAEANKVAKDRAGETFEQFMRRYKDKPQECSAALAVLAKACDGMGGY